MSSPEAGRRSTVKAGIVHPDEIALVTACEMDDRRVVGPAVMMDYCLRTAR